MKRLLTDHFAGTSYSARLRSRDLVTESVLARGFPYSRRLRAHTSCVNALTFSSGSGQFLASGGDDCIINLWNFYEEDFEQPCCSFIGPRGNIFNLEFSANNHYLFSGGTDNTVFKFDLSAEKVLNMPGPGLAAETYHEHDDSIRDLTCHKQNEHILLSASDAGRIVLHDGRTGNILSRAQAILQESVEITGVRFHPFMEHIFASSDNHGGVYLRDMRMSFGSLIQRTNRGIVHSYNTKLSKRGVNRLANPEACSLTFNREGDMLAVTLLCYLPTIYSINDSQPIATCSGALLPDGAPVPPDQRTYTNCCTIKHGSFGSLGLQRDSFYSAGSDDFRGYIWKIPELPEMIERRIQLTHAEWCSRRMPYDIAFAESVTGTHFVPVELSRPHCRLTGHDSIVNTALFHPHLPHIVTAGIESHITLHSPTRSSPCSSSLKPSPLDVRALPTRHAPGIMRRAIVEGLSTNDMSERETIRMFDQLLRADSNTDLFEMHARSPDSDTENMDLDLADLDDFLIH